MWVEKFHANRIEEINQTRKKKRNKKQSGGFCRLYCVSCSQCVLKSKPKNEISLVARMIIEMSAKLFSDGECMISGHTIGYYAFVSRLKKSGSLMVVENELIIANLSKSTLNRHEQVRE